jgi:hypothetical protein
MNLRIQFPSAYLQLLFVVTGGILYREVSYSKWEYMLLIFPITSYLTYSRIQTFKILWYEINN